MMVCGWATFCSWASQFSLLCPSLSVSLCDYRHRLVTDDDDPDSYDQRPLWAKAGLCSFTTSHHISCSTCCLCVCFMSCEQFLMKACRTMKRMIWKEDSVAWSRECVTFLPVSSLTWSRLVLVRSNPIFCVYGGNAHLLFQMKRSLS